MNEERKIAYMIAIYGLMQKVLKSHELVDDKGRPLKIKNIKMHEQDAVTLYKWFAQALRHTHEDKMNTRKQIFNDMAKALKDDHLLNMYLLALFMAEALLDNDLSPLDKNMLMPKVERMIKHVRQGIIDANGENPEEGQQTIIDSKICSSNIHRKFSGQAELTKDIREKNRNRWREALRNKSK